MKKKKDALPNLEKKRCVTEFRKKKMCEGIKNRWY
jgi:hypothetical protein